MGEITHSDNYVVIGLCYLETLPCSVPFMSQVEATIRRNLKALICELGPTVVLELENLKTFEIMLNPDGKLWVGRLGEPTQYVGDMAPVAALSMLNTVGVSITAENLILEAEPPIDGFRLQGLIPPVVARPTFAIRKKAVAVFTLDNYVEKGILSERYRDIIRKAVRARRNVLVVGRAGSGKTMLCNAIVHEIVEATPAHRVALIEDTAEIHCAAKNATILHTSKTVDLGQLLCATMRLFPTRVFVGEVRVGVCALPVESLEHRTPQRACHSPRRQRGRRTCLHGAIDLRSFCASNTSSHS